MLSRRPEIGAAREWSPSFLCFDVNEGGGMDASSSTLSRYRLLHACDIAATHAAQRTCLLACYITDRMPLLYVSIGWLDHASQLVVCRSLLCFDRCFHEFSVYLYYADGGG